MAESAESIRQKRTRAQIKRAMRELVLEMDPDKVTVKAIADRAMINRKTFYLYYDSIESLFAEELEETINRFFDEAEETPNDLEDFSGHAKRFFMFLAQQDESTARLVCANMRYDFGERLYLMQMERYRRAGNPFSWMGDEMELVLRFIRTSALQFFRNWVHIGRVVDPEVAADLLGVLTEHGVTPLIRLP